MSTRPITPRRPVQRAFTGLVGLPPEREEIVQAEPATSSSVVQVMVTALMEAVEAANTNEQVKTAVRDAFAPPVPVKRGRGRPAKYINDDERREAERLRKQKVRTKVKQDIQFILGHFLLGLDTKTAPSLKEKYGTDAETYRELLDRDSVKNKVLRQVIRDLKDLGIVKDPRSKFGSTAMSRGTKVGRNRLIKTDDVETVDGVRTAQQRSLSNPRDFYADLDTPRSSLDPEILDVQVAGDRRRKRPAGKGADQDHEGAVKSRLYPTG